MNAPIKVPEKPKAKSGTAIMRCTCKHEFQDERYGKGQRVHNFVYKSDKWRCTVCNSVK